MKPPLLINEAAAKRKEFRGGKHLKNWPLGTKKKVATSKARRASHL